MQYIQEIKNYIFPQDQTKGQKILTYLALIFFIIGLVGFVDRMYNGHTNANYGSYVPWGLWIAGYLYLIGLSSGVFVMTALVYVFNVKVLEKIGKMALLLALATLVAALLTVWSDLGHMDRAWRLSLRTSFQSVMGWMSWLYSSYAILLTIELWFALKPDLVKYSNENSLRGKICNFLNFGKKELTDADKEKYKRILKILGSIGIPLAISFSGSVGAIFGVVGARSYWHSGITPIIFLVGGLLSGSSLLAFILMFWRPSISEEEFQNIMKYIGNLMLGLLLFFVLLEWAEFSVILWKVFLWDTTHVFDPHAESYKIIVAGPFWWVFWIIHLGFGVIVPLYFLVKEKSPKNVAIAGGLIAFTFISVRLNIVIPGMVVPLFEELIGTYAGPGLTFDYVPSLFEWLVFFFTVSLGAWVFILGKSLLPIMDIENHQ